jgi:hypothetical protein
VSVRRVSARSVRRVERTARGPSVHGVSQCCSPEARGRTLRPRRRRPWPVLVKQGDEAFASTREELMPDLDRVSDVLSRCQAEPWTS